MIPKDDLRKIVMLEKLSDDMLDTIIPEINVLKLREKEVIFNDGDEASKFYMLLTGKILLEKHISEKITVSLGAIKPGYVFGWSAIFDEPYSFMALCAEDSEILMINSRRLQDLMNNDHTIGYLISQSLTRTLKNRMDRVGAQFLRAIKEHPDIETLIEQ